MLTSRKWNIKTDVFNKIVGNTLQEKYLGDMKKLRSSFCNSSLWETWFETKNSRNRRNLFDKNA